MKKAMVFALLFTVLCAGIFAQDRIAVFPFEDLDNIFSRNEALMFYREFSNEFANRSAGKFAVVPRQEVERLINTETRFQLSEFSAQEKTAEMNRVLNGTQILSGVIGKVGSRLSITVSLYSYPELVQQTGGTTLRVANIDELFDKIPELVQGMRDAIAANLPAYRVGDRGPGGGFIFFAENGVYMECSMDIGSFNWDGAVRAAQNHRGGGFTNWRLPSDGELRLMYRNLNEKGLGGFSNNWYWSSSQYDNKRAWTRKFNTGQENYHSKDYTYLVRAIRQFTQEK